MDTTAESALQEMFSLKDSLLEQKVYMDRKLELISKKGAEKEHLLRRMSVKQ